jgi:predicted nucleotidyltransferase
MGARRILLFGSILDSPETARDIDLAVEGIPLNRIIDADVAVYEILKLPMDLISREENPAFFDMIKDDAKVLYEEREIKT